MLHRSMWYYASKARDSSLIRKRMREIARVRIRYGYCHRGPGASLPCLEEKVGQTIISVRSADAVYWLYKEEGLNLRSKRPRRNKAAAHCLERMQVTNMNQYWSMDFVADQLFDGRKFRALTVVAAAAADNFSRKCLTIQVGQSIKGMDVVEVMERIKQETGAVPERIQVDNGSECSTPDLSPKPWISGSTITKLRWISQCRENPGCVTH